MGEKIVYIDFDNMEKFMRDVFIAIGVPKEDAKISAHVLISADKQGFDSHGIARMKTIYYDRIKNGIQKPKTHFEIIKEGPTTAVVDGHNGMGHVISKRSMEMAITKAKQYGMGMVAVRNSTHYGIAGYYVQMACNAGMVGITGTNARPSVAPTFGVENMLGTNPLTVGVPTDEAFSFVFDAATSITQRGKIEVYGRINKEIPKGWVIGETGKARTDTKQILQDLNTGKAALTPLGGIGEDTGGHKGYGYSTFVELLCAALQDGSYLKMLLGQKDGKPAPCPLGHFFIAINIESFIPLARFKEIAGTILRQLRNSKRAPGQKKIFTAGEKEYITCQERKGKGVALNKKLQEEVITMRDEQGLSVTFPFEGV